MIFCVDELDRKLQADAVMEMARNKKDKYTPTILIGYLTSAPYTNYYPPLIESGWRDSLNSLDRYCEYILYKVKKKFFTLRKIFFLTNSP